MALVFIGLGSNLGNPVTNLQEAWRRIGRITGLTALAISSPYSTEPVGMKQESGKTVPCSFESDLWFANAVGVLDTRVGPEELLEKLLAVEKAMGRTRGASADRLIDLDILYYDDLVLESDMLSVPHPEMQKRLFVLAPLTELAPDHLHPTLLKTSSEMRRNLPVASGQSVHKINWPSPDRA